LKRREVVRARKRRRGADANGICSLPRRNKEERGTDKGTTVAGGRIEKKGPQHIQLSRWTEGGERRDQKLYIVRYTTTHRFAKKEKEKKTYRGQAQGILIQVRKGRGTCVVVLWAKRGEKKKKSQKSSRLKGVAMIQGKGGRRGRKKERKRGDSLAPILQVANREVEAGVVWLRCERGGERKKGRRAVPSNHMGGETTKGEPLLTRSSIIGERGNSG